MRRRLLLLALLLVFAVAFTAAPAVIAQENMAEVHGTIYDLWAFMPLENVVLEVYSGSTLRMQTVIPDGFYSLSLSTGSYTIFAKYYSGAALMYDAEENITLQENDNITLDIIMFPAFEENDFPENYEELPGIEEGEATGVLLAAMAVLIIIAGTVAYYLMVVRPKRKPGAVKKAEAPPSAKVVGLPDDLREVLDAMRESGGRTTQLELRQKLPYSEAKVSLMVADLEHRGLIRKIKKGRGNILVLAEK